MGDSYRTTAVAFGDLKNGWLYFDHLIPVFLVTEMFVEERRKKFIQKGDAELFPPELVQRPGFLEALGDVNSAMSNVFLKLTAKRFNLEPKLQCKFSEEEYAAIEDKAMNAYFSFVERFNLGSLPVASEGETAGQASLLPAEDSSVSPLVTLMGLRVIDVSEASWEQIMELRRDVEARRKLRRLRLFAYENYAGRAAAFVEDDILTRLADYEEVVREWGFNTIKGAVSNVLNAKILASGVGGSILSAILGCSVEASIAAGAVVQLGHVAIELTKEKFALQKLTRESPVSFISYSRERLSGKTTLP